MIRYKKCRIF